MDKEIIEEMAAIIVGLAGFSAHEKAEFLVNAGYRKIPEGAVVFIPTEKQYAILTKEEYKTYLAMKSIETNLIEIEKDKARKETADKFAERLKEKLEKYERKIMCEDYQQGAYVYMVDSSDIDICIDEIAKEIMEGKV